MIDIWGGIECTVNRVGDAYFDQLAMSGHAVVPDAPERAMALIREFILKR